MVALASLILCAAADTTPHVAVNALVPFESADFPSWTKLASARDIMGTMNGPREIYPVQDSQPVYNTTQYGVSFAELGAYAVRFNDLNYGQGAYNSTSITQIFTAWPTTDR